MTIRYQRNRRVLWRRSHDTVFLMLPDRPEIVSLAGAGSALWELLAQPTTAGEAIDSLARLYGAATETVARDIPSLLDDLVDRQLAHRQEVA